MHEIVYIRANYEPWWMFDGWQENTISRKQFASADKAQHYLAELEKQLSRQFAESEKRDPAFTAFWNSEEIEYCEICEEDLQIFHGLIWLYNGKPKISF